MLVGLIVGMGIGLGVGAGAREDPPLVFAAKTGVVLTFVLPDKVDEFERFLTEFRGVLAASEDPIRQQQAGTWRVFKSSDAGPNGSVVYVGLIRPVLRGANYNIATLMAEELPEDEEQSLMDRFRRTLAQPPSALNLEAVAVADLANMSELATGNTDTP